MREADSLRDPGGDPDRPVRARRDEPVDLARAGEAVDGLLVLGGEDSAIVGQREADGLRVAVDSDHVQVATSPCGLEQAELGCPGA
jgi:hypothetical protein